MVLGPLSRRAFMKGIAALAGSKILPKGLANIATKEVAKKIPYAPPWVGNLVNTLQRTPLHTSKFNFAKVGNNAIAAKLGSKTKKIYGGGTAKETHFRVKPAASRVGDDPKLGIEGQKWDDIVLTEEPGQTSITWRNKDYDHGNNQHIVIDHKNKETRFVDDNWSMEAGGEDIVKDNWIEYKFETDKVKLDKELKVMDRIKEIDPNWEERMVDYASVNDMDNYYADTFKEYVDSFSPSGNIFSSVKRAEFKLQKEQLRKLEKIQNDIDVRALKEKQMAEWEEQFRGGFGMHGFNKGGEVKYDYFKDVVPPLEPVDNFQAGGLAKLFVKKAPKVISKLREWAPQITGKAYKPPKGPYTIVDQSGVSVAGTYHNLKGAQVNLAKFEKLRKEKFRIVGARPPKTAEGVWEAAPEVDLSMIGQKVKAKPKPTDAPSMFYRSREEIIEGPPVMSGQQWMDFLKKRGIRDSEMMDTSLGPWLSHNLTNKVSKNDLVKKFDSMVPDFTVQVTGHQFGTASRISSALDKMDASVYSPEAGGIIRFMQANAKRLDDEEGAAKFLGKLDDLFSKAYGVDDVTTAGIPVNNMTIPYEIRMMMSDVLGATRQRGVGMESSAFVSDPSHGTSQVMPGASKSNYREFLFGWKPKGPRKVEPTYEYQHTFGKAKKENAFMHVRTSDRTDEFGNKLLFMEEIQSDMHQPISAAIRRAEQAGKPIPKEGRYAARLDVAPPVDSKANLEQMANIQRQIDRLLETNPNSPKLQNLYEKKEIIRNIETPKIAANTSGVPEGPFKDSQDYMEFAIKYLLRVAKDGKYDGVAFSTPAIKNASLTATDQSFKGNIFAYGPILNNAIRKAKVKSGAEFFETSIVAKGSSYDDIPKAYGVPALLIKGNIKALERISRGLPAYKEGGSVKTEPLYGVMKDVVPPL